MSSPISSNISQNNAECLKNSVMKCSKGTRKSNDSWLIWKKQQRPIVLSMQLRKQEKRQRPRQKRKPKSRRLQKRRRKRNR